MRCGLLLVLLLVASPQPPPEEPPEEPVLGARSAFDLSGERAELARLAAGTPLHREPAPRSPVLVRVDFDVDLEVIERRDGWVLVLYGSYRGWAPEDPDAVGSAVDEAGQWVPEPTTPPQLERARALLGERERQSTLGPFTLYTDVTDQELLGALSRLATQLPRRFAERYGVEPRAAEAVVVLFAAESTYETYAEGEGGLAALDTAGHSIGDLAVLSVGKPHRREAEVILVHELTHVLTYRALGPDLPAWLMEGLAEDLAYCRLDQDGNLVLGSLDGWDDSRVRHLANGARLVTRSRGGPRLSLEELLRAWKTDQRPSLEALLDAPPLEVMGPGKRKVRYPMSAFFVRYLLARDGDAFRAFLAAAARGELIDGLALTQRLGVGWRELEEDFERWIKSRAPSREEG